MSDVSSDPRPWSERPITLNPQLIRATGSWYVAGFIQELAYRQSAPSEPVIATMAEWGEWLMLSVDQVRRIVARAERLGLVEHTAGGRGGRDRTSAIRLIPEALTHVAEFPDACGEIAECPVEIPVKSVDIPVDDGSHSAKSPDDLVDSCSVFTHENQQETLSPPSGERKRERERVRAETDSLFDRFWSMYPRHVAKKSSRGAFVAALAKVDDPEVIFAAVEAAKTRLWSETDPKFVPHATTWLRQERWLDDLPERAQPLVMVNLDAFFGWVSGARDAGDWLAANEIGVRKTFAKLLKWGFTSDEVLIRAAIGMRDRDFLLQPVRLANLPRVGRFSTGLKDPEGDFERAFVGMWWPAERAQ
jgi:hypothetical protein